MSPIVFGEENNWVEEGLGFPGGVTENYNYKDNYNDFSSGGGLEQYSFFFKSAIDGVEVVGSDENKSNQAHHKLYESNPLGMRQESTTKIP